MRDKKQKGVALVLSALMLLVLIPIIGLGIDGGVAYMLRTKLSAAVDAAVLADSRSLSTGADLQSQTANATAVAQKYFDANFPAGTWNSQNMSRSATVNEDDVTHVRSVSVTASVDAPLYFMGILNQTTARISLTGTAKRRDVNVMLVLDRSYSMGAYVDSKGSSHQCGTCGAIPAMINAATSFVNQFAQGRDKVGMVAFGGDYYRVLPSTNFSTLAGKIGQITSAGNTGSAQALWQAYDALGNLPEKWEPRRRTGGPERHRILRRRSAKWYYGQFCAVTSEPQHMQFRQYFDARVDLANQRICHRSGYNARPFHSRRAGCFGPK